MTPDDEIREAARLAQFLATGEIEPRYDVRDVLGRGCPFTLAHASSRMGGSGENPPDKA